MARPRKQLTDTEKMRDIETYTHDDKKRTNNPPVGMAQHDKAEEKLKTYQFDPHLDPTLQWAGKAEGMSFQVPTSSIHIHESICTCPAMPSFSSREFMITRLSPAIMRLVQSTPC